MAHIEASILTAQIDPAAVEMCYSQLISWLEQEGYNRAELMAAMICCLGTQYNGSIVAPEKMEAFIKDMTDYLAAYFAKGARN